MADRRASAEEIEVRRSPRLTSRIMGPPAEHRTSVPGGAQRLSDDQHSVMVEISANRAQSLVDFRNSTSSSARSSGIGVISQPVGEAMVRRGERETEIDGLFAPWRAWSSEMQQRNEMLVGTPWHAFLEIKGNKIVET